MSDNTNSSNKPSNIGSSFRNNNNSNSKESPLFVIVRLPIKRPQNFVDPPCTLWNETKEQLLWEYLNRNKGRNIDWNYLSQELQIPVPYLIKFSSFLYEVQLLKLRNQTWTVPEDIDFDRDNITDSVEIRESEEERGETTEEEREVLNNLNMLQTKMLEEPYLTTETTRSTPFVTPLTELPSLSRDFLGLQLNEKLEKFGFNNQESNFDKNENDKFRFGHSLQDLNTIRQTNSNDNNNNNQANANNNNEEEIDSNSIGSPYSDLSDESVTQSQLEDAFLSKFNKYSIFRKSHFY
ncbi:hypothetical protein CONCODRAFT_16218 [Conidiobolus coronatus NRRL 28638]|uniref:Autophagy-related protein 29 n=1 Tax=Conidiobolus coronatus (strain ATCC 28846 / CBS 209.66 / NRRL 28638) TaxID=796925 RepID=A0A137PBJ2_CONC2|nr:hypothetical protein CONCODRAFT_16218 [Conidiobolus coronatus NRRL 28638]|eukprot:KXN72378.1 hypothetical protein CONCODRAFT_16218 [Conidiobolus coronatus NRRL 28638]